jgi:hypothetical protein
LASGDNLNLQNSSIVGATTITANKFIGPLEGNATSADILNNASNITTGTINSSRLSGFYGIDVNSANILTDAANITSGFISSERLNGRTYNIDIEGNAASADSLNDAANIIAGIIDPARLSGTYGINVSSAATSFDLAPGLYAVDISGNAATATIATNLSGGNVTGTNLNISGISTLASSGGITTTGGDLYVGGNLYANVGEINISTAKIGFSSITNASIGVATVGFLTATNIRVSGTSTVGFLTAFNISTPNARIGILTATTLSNISNAGISSLTVDYIRAIEITSIDRINTGIATIGIASITNAYIGVATVGEININSGIASVGFASITNAYIGVATVGEININSGIASVGFASITNAYIGIATIDQININSGIASVGFASITNAYIGIATIDQININSGIASVGIATIGIASITNAYIGIATIDQININSGIASVGFASITNAYIGIATIDQININSGILTVTTFSGNLVGIASTATTALGFSTTANINTSGIITSTGGFVGGLTGTASTATTALGFSTTANINTSGIITATGGFVGGLTGTATTAVNVIGGIASVTQLQVGPGITTVGFITASSLQVSGITTLGITSVSELNSAGIVTASFFSGSGLNLVGIVTQLTVGTGLTLTSSQAIGKGTVQVGIKTSIGKTIYVAFEGSDTNTGLVESDAKRTIKAAAALALPGDTIKVFPGTYVENNPITLATNISVQGTELRNCIVTPQSPGLDLFYVNNGCHMTNLSFNGAPATNNAAVVSFVPLAGVASDRFFDAARLIRLNLDFITDETVEYLTSTDYKNPVFNTGISTIKQGVKFALKAVSHDITRGGNSKCVGAGKSYYTTGGVLQNIVGFKTETIDALNYAAGIARSCINNVSFAKTSGGNYQTYYTQVKDLSMQPDGAYGNQSISGCANVVSAIYSCVGVVTTIINQGLSVLGVGINTTYPGNSGLGTSVENDPSFSPGVGNIDKGPYIRNCTNFIANSIGLKVDGFTAEPGDQDDIGVTGSMSVDSYTQYNQGGIGVSITNGGYSQLVSIFTICDDIAIYTSGGGQCDITNSNSSFGNYGLYSVGVGDNTTKSIYRYTGTATTEATARSNVITISGVGTNRPYDGQSCYFGILYYNINAIQLNIDGGGSGYTNPPTVTISNPTGPNGVTAQASATVVNGSVTAINLLNSGSQYLSGEATVTIDGPGGEGTTAEAFVSNYQPIYYKVSSATLPSAGISTVTFLQTLNNTVSAGTTVYFARGSLQLASTISFEHVGAGTNIFTAKPALGGVVIPENKVVQIDGGTVTYTSTDQSGNFNIGDGVVINQSTGQISGRDFTKALFTTMTPFILALSD